MRSRAGTTLVFFIVGGAATLVVAADPAARFAFPRPSLHIALETTAAIVAFIAGVLVYGRFRQHDRLDDLLLLGALVALSATNLFFAAIPAALAQTNLGTFTTWAPLIGRVVAAVLFAASAIVRPITLKAPERTAVSLGILLLVALGLVGTTVALGGRDLPSGVDPSLAAHSASLSNLSTHPLVASTQFIAMGLYALAAVGFSTGERSGDDEFRSWLALGATFAALSALHYGLFPSLYTDWVYTGDVFRLLFYLSLLVGAARVISVYWRRLALVAVLEERARVARDLHDGVAQELAFITRRARRTDGADDLPMRQIAAASQRALVDSRLVIAALTRPVDEPLEVALAQSVEDAAARVGTNVHIDIAPGTDVSPEARDAMIRIATEAVTNAARHAPGAPISVVLEADPVRLRITDEGDGFDPDAVMRTTDAGFGLTSMRERAKALGADLQITSTIGGGTQIELVLP